MKTWELNYLDLFNSNEKNQLYFYYKFLRSKQFRLLKGDIVEAGVYRGKSLVSTALYLKKIKSKKKVWGYDTFSGFPKIDKEDSFKNFSILKKNKQISNDHYLQVKKLKKYFSYFSFKKLNALNVSSSSNFSDTSRSIVLKKIKFFKLKRFTKLIEGSFSKTMKEKKLPDKISAGLIDCDLFEGYNVSLKYFWPKLEKNGRLFLDEYYSLKFPGPRIAVNNFVYKNKDAELIYDGTTLGFERWSLKKK